MKRKSIDVSRLYRAAEAHAREIDFADQYGVPDIATLLRTAWSHGYVVGRLSAAARRERRKR